MLHDPHTDYEDDTNRSYVIISGALRAILESAHWLSVSSFDLSLLPSEGMNGCWLSSMRVICRMYRLALERDDLPRSTQLKANLDVME
jgi:hypothetical protein